MVQAFGDIPYDKLYLVRVQGGLKGVSTAGDTLILDRSGSGRADNMNTFHFALNGIVENHLYGGQFDGSEYAIIAPLEDACLKTGNIPSGLNPVDTYFHADAEGTMKLPQALVVVPEDAFVPESILPLVRKYPRGSTPEETMLNRNKSIKGIFLELDAPTHIIGPHYWVDYPDICADDKETLARHLCGNHEVSVFLASDGISSHWERAALQTTRYLDSYKRGERTVERHHTQEEVPLFREVANNLDYLRTFIAERQSCHADPKAIAFYQRRLAVLVSQEEEILPLRRADLKKNVSYYSQYYVSYDGKEKTGPLSADDMIERVSSGALSASHLVWHKEMSKWKPFAELLEHDSFQEIAKIDQKIGAPQKPVLQSTFTPPPIPKTAPVKASPSRPANPALKSP